LFMQEPSEETGEGSPKIGMFYSFPAVSKSEFCFLGLSFISFCISASLTM
jgi:hypothetical protein